MVKSEWRWVGALCLVTLVITGCQGNVKPAGHGSAHVAHHAPASASEPPAGADITTVVRLRDTVGLADILQELDGMRVVYVGERHDRYGDHLNQLAVIREMHARNPSLAIGMEMFDVTQQAELERYINGDISELEMLRNTGYFQRWRFDFRLYQPILAFAREHGLKILALNVPRELNRRVAEVGFDGLDEAQRAMVPRDIAEPDEEYRRRLQESFAQHPNRDAVDFEHFLQAMLLWDEGMAEQAADYLRRHPDTRMVVLAGSGHLVHGEGIPDRLRRRLELRSAILLNGLPGEMAPGIADYLLFSPDRELPRSGRLGVMLDTSGEHVSVQGFVPDSAARQAGLEDGDLILAIDDNLVHSYADLRLALWSKHVGDTVTVSIRRDQLLWGRKELDFSVTLR